MQIAAWVLGQPSPLGAAGDDSLVLLLCFQDWPTEFE